MKRDLLNELEGRTEKVGYLVAGTSKQYVSKIKGHEGWHKKRQHIPTRIPEAENVEEAIFEEIIVKR